MILIIIKLMLILIQPVSAACYVYGGCVAGFIRQQHLTINNEASTQAADLLLDCATLSLASKYFPVSVEEKA